MKRVAKPFPKLIKSTPNKTNTNLNLAYDKKIENEFGVLFVGDTSFMENYVSEYALRKNVGINVLEHYGRDYFFEKVKPILLDSDLVIANLETPLIDEKNTKNRFFLFPQPVVTAVSKDAFSIGRIKQKPLSTSKSTTF